MRHGKADHVPDDSEQQLTVDGRAGIERLAQDLSKKDLQIEQIFHSEKTRARQTAEIMARHLAPNITLNERSDFKPNSDPKPLLLEIGGWKKNTLITSHLPFVPSLLILLLGDQKSTYNISFEPGTLVCLEKQDKGDWLFQWVAAP